MSVFRISTFGCFLVALIALQGCCSTVRYEVESKTTSVPEDVAVGLAARNIWRPLPNVETVVIRDTLLAGSTSEIARIVRFGDTGDGAAASTSVQSRYMTLLNQSTVPNWSISKSEYDELVRLEAILLKQPGIVECLRSRACKDELLRVPSKDFARYQSDRSLLAAARDALERCLSTSSPCETERDHFEQMNSEWTANAKMLAIDDALKQYSTITSRDPESMKVSAIDLFEQFKSELKLPDDSLEGFFAWMSHSPPSNSVSSLPDSLDSSELVLVDVSQKWLDYDLLASGLLRLRKEEIYSLKSRPIFVPRVMVLTSSSSLGDTRRIGIVGIIGDEINAIPE